MTNRVIETRELSPEPAGASLSPRCSSHGNPPPGSGLSQGLEEGPRAGRGSPAPSLSPDSPTPAPRSASLVPSPTWSWGPGSQTRGGAQSPLTAWTSMGQGRVLPSSQGEPAGGPQDSGQPHSRLRSAPAPIREKEVCLFANAQMTRQGPSLTPLCRIQGAALFLCPQWQTRVDWVNPSRIVVFPLIIKTHTYYRRCRKIQRTLRSPIVPEAVCGGFAPRPRQGRAAARCGSPSRPLVQHVGHDHSCHLLRSVCPPRGAALTGATSSPGSAGPAAGPGC